MVDPMVNPMVDPMVNPMVIRMVVPMVDLLILLKIKYERRLIAFVVLLLHFPYIRLRSIYKNL